MRMAMLQMGGPFAQIRPPSFTVRITGLVSKTAILLQRRSSQAWRYCAIGALLIGSVMIVYWPIITSALESLPYQESNSSESEELNGQPVERSSGVEDCSFIASRGRLPIALDSLSLQLGAALHGRSVE